MRIFLCLLLILTCFQELFGNNFPKETSIHRSLLAFDIRLKHQALTDLKSAFVSIQANSDNSESRLSLPVKANNSSRFSIFSNSLKSAMSATSATQRYVKLGAYFFLIYFFTIVYNISSKKVLDVVPLPCTISTIMLLIGIPLFLPLWIVKPPSFAPLSSDLKGFSLISLCHGLGHIATTYALSSGSVSFVHVVKSAEPLFAAMLSFLITRKSMPFRSYASLIPIVVGVGLASFKEFSFSWFGFSAAMISNLLYPSRMVLSKKILSDKPGKQLSASNTFRMITAIAFLELLPITFLLEGSRIREYFTEISTNIVQRNYILRHLLFGGISFYLYNEIAFWVLDLVHPVTSAVGNSIKRVVLVIASIIIFRTPVNSIGMIGSVLAIIGSLLYALGQEQKEILNISINSTQHITTHKDDTTADVTIKREPQARSWNT
jgi:solute carrier family 35 protein E1